MILKHENLNENTYDISVIMPSYNTEKYIAQALDSILAQTFQNFEILCFDDGSTDHTIDILRQYASKYPCIQVFENTNHGQGYERNMGILKARGKYLYYMDSDDILDHHCFETLYQCAEDNHLQLIYFEGTSFYENKELEAAFPSFKTLYTRKGSYPDVYTGEDLYVQLRNNASLIICPCFQMVRRDYIIQNQLFFPEMRGMEDNLYTIRTLIHASRVKCINHKLFYRRVRPNSTMTGAHSQEKISYFCTIIRELLKDIQQYPKDSILHSALCKHLQQGYYRSLKQEILTYKKEHSNSPWYSDFDSGDLDILLSVTFTDYLDQELYRVNDKLKQTYREKSEINAKLQQTYHEKSEINAKLKEAHHEKEERGLTIRQLNKENANLKHQLEFYKKPFVIRFCISLKNKLLKMKNTNRTKP